MKTWRSALMLLQPRMSPGFQDPSESNRAMCNVEGPRSKLCKRAPGEGKPATVVTRLWIWGGTSVQISRLYPPCMSTMSSRASRTVTRELLLVTKHCLLSSLEEVSAYSFCISTLLINSEVDLRDLLHKNVFIGCNIILLLIIIIINLLSGYCLNCECVHYPLISQRHQWPS